MSSLCIDLSSWETVWFYELVGGGHIFGMYEVFENREVRVIAQLFGDMLPEGRAARYDPLSRADSDVLTE